MHAQSGLGPPVLRMHTGLKMPSGCDTRVRIGSQIAHMRIENAFAGTESPHPPPLHKRKYCQRHSSLRLGRGGASIGALSEEGATGESAEPASAGKEGLDPLESQSSGAPSLLETVSTASTAIQGPVTGKALLLSSWQKLRQRLPAILAVAFLSEAALFLLYRCSHRLTNAVAMGLLGPGYTREAMGNLWFLCNNPALDTFVSGYQYIIYAGFVLALPLCIILQSYRVAAVALICRNGDQAPALTDIRGTLAYSWRTVQAAGRDLATRAVPIGVVALFLAARLMALQAASLLVIPLYWTLPRILDLQATLPAAIMEGKEGVAAVQRSQGLLKSLRKSLMAPFLALVIIGKALQPLKAVVLANMPSRFYRDLPEIPILVLVGMSAAIAILSCLSDVLPYAAYEAGVATEGAHTEDESAPQVAAL